ncbi:UNVERIFIED_CONTAM: hypothetical protein HDU68_009943, partial [Siphonaria sp. JEL0065]
MFHKGFDPTGVFETARHIGLIAIYTGVATVEGQAWVANIDVFQSVDLTFHYNSSKFATHLALCVRDAQWKGQQVKHAAELTLVRLLVRLWVEGLAVAFAASVSATPGAQKL